MVELRHFASAEGLRESREPFKQIGEPASHRRVLRLGFKGEQGGVRRRGVRSQNLGARRALGVEGHAAGEPDCASSFILQEATLGRPL